MFREPQDGPFSLLPEPPQPWKEFALIMLLQALGSSCWRGRESWIWGYCPIRRVIITLFA